MEFQSKIRLIGGATPFKDNPEYWNGNIVWLSSQEIKNKYVSNGTYTITKKAIIDNKTRMVDAGTPLIVTRSGILAKRFPLSIPTIDVAINQDIKALIFDQSKLNVNFLVAELQSKEAYILKKIIKTGTTVQSVNLPDLNKMIISVVSDFKEQKKIGEFFQKLDQAITLQQRKLDLLKKLKQGYLQQMFPAKNMNIPQLRFFSFKSDWKQRNLGDMVAEFSVKSKTENRYKILSSTNAGMEIRHGRVSGISNIGYKIIENGDLVLSPQNLWLGNININNLGTGLVSPSYKTFKFVDVNANYLSSILRTSKMLEEYKNSSTQGASVVRRNLELNLFYKIPILIPDDNEQGEIANFISAFDKLYKYQKNKLELLEKNKKGYLQKMFP